MKQNYLQKILFILLCCFAFTAYGQTYTPIPVSGFNQDGIAETVPASASTTQGLDGGNVLYSVDYATAATLPGGVINTGTIVSGTSTYQMEPFNQNNVLRLTNNETGTLQIISPKAYTYLSLMGFGTNGNKAFTVEVKFTDGTSYTVPGSYVDWWNTTANVATALGRVNRTTGATDNNTPLTRPNFHRFDITLSGGNEYKIVEEVTITSSATGASACFFALSGEATPLVTCPADIVVNNDAGTCGAVVNFADPITAVDQRPRILLLYVDPVGQTVTDVQVKLTATGNFSVIDSHNAGISTPDLTTLQQYHAVLLWTNAAVLNSNLLGDNLAAYIESGGGVVDMAFENAELPVGGAYNTDTYRVLNPLNFTSGTTRTLGTVLQPTHPLMSGITSFNGGTGSYISTSTTLATGAYLVANYDNNAPFIIAKENVGAQNANRVSLNFYPGSDNIPGWNSVLWLATTDGAKIISNALTWVAKSVYTQTSGLVSTSLFPIGVTTNTYEVTDVYGTTETCSFTVTVNDTEAPVVITQDITVVLDGVTGQATITTAQVDNGSSDNCTIQTMTVAPDTFDQTNLGTNIVTLTVTDTNGNQSTGTATVTVTLPPAPAITCPADIIVNNDASQCGAIVNYIEPGASRVLILGADNASWLPDVQAKIVGTGRFQVVDIFNSSVGTPAIALLEQYDAILVYTQLSAQDPTALGNVIAAYIDGGGAVVDACFDNASIPIGGAYNTDTYRVLNPSSQTQGTTRTLGTIDMPAHPIMTGVTAFNGGAGSFHSTSTSLATGAYMIARYDNNAPLIMAKENVGPQNVRRVSLNFYPGSEDLPGYAGNLWLTATDGALIMANALEWAAGTTATNNTITQTAGLASGQTFPVGVTTNTFEISDIFGQTDICSFTVTVTDNELPLVVTQDITVQLDAVGFAGITPLDINNGSTDNCAIDTMVLDIIAFDCTNVGPNTVTLTVTDVNGNVATGTATVTIEDVIVPIVVTQDITVQLDATGNVTITPAQVDNGSSDNCVIDTMVLDATTFDCTNIGANAVTLTVTDVNGNIATGTANVTVEDVIVPTVVTQDITVQLDAAGTVSIIPAQVDNGSADNCAIDTMVLDVTTFDCTNIGANAVTLTVTDVNGNVGTSTATVTVEDTTAPVITCVAPTATGNIIVNGSFETGDFTGWTTIDNPVPLYTYAVHAVSNNIYFPVASPTEGGFFAENGFDGNTGIAVMYQDVAIPADATSAILSWDENIDYSVGGTGRTYEVQIRETNDNILETVHQIVATGFNDDNVWNTVTADLSAYAGQTIRIAFWQNIPQDYTGPGKFSLDNVTLLVNQGSGTPVDVVLDANGVATVNASDLIATVTENCTAYTVTVAGQPTVGFDCTMLGLNIVTVTVEDANGNIATCNSQINIIDTTIPTITCPADVVTGTDLGVCSASTVALGTPVTADNCTVATVTNDAPATFAVGNTTVTWTVTDQSGNTATCTQTVTVNDTELPTVVTQDITVQLDAAGNAVIIPSQIDNGSADNCAIDTIVLDVSTFDCTNTGANTVTLTVTDIHGNVNTNTAIVTVEDTIAPIVITQNITVQLDASGTATIVPSQVDNGSNDACGIASMTLDITDFDCTSAGPNTVVLTVTDVNGNISTGTAIVTVEDNILPVAVAQNITVQLNAAGQAIITPAQIDNGSSDNCAFTLSLDIIGFNCADLGDNNVMLTVTDASGNTATAPAVVTVEDVQLPALFAGLIPPAPVTIEGLGRSSSYTNVNLNGTNSNVAFVAPGATVSFSYDYASAYTGGAGCPSCITQHNVGINGIFYDCHDADTGLGSVNRTFTAPAAPGVYYITQTATWWFSCGQFGAPGFNDSDASVAVAVLIVSNTNAVCHQTVSQDADPGQCNAVVNNIDVTALDNCTTTLNYTIVGATTATGTGSASGNVFNVGTSTVTYTATDAAGNATSCSFDVVITDAEAPVVNTQDITIQLDAAGLAVITPAQIENGSTDNCAVDTFTLDITTFDCTNVGANTVTLTVTDIHGNSATNTAIVTVQDNIAPVVATQDITVQLDAAGQVSITPAQVDNGSADACGIASMALDITDFDCTDVGPNTVVLTVTDVNGNVSAGTAVVTVEDTVAPVVVTQDITVQLDAAGQAIITPAQIDNGSADACDIASMTLDITDFDCTNVGPNAVVLTVTDVNGNVANNTAIVTIEDTVVPVVVTQDITVQLDATGTVTITPAQIDNGSADACGIATMTLDITDFDCTNVGPNTVTLTVTDVNGNFATGTAVVTVEDNIAPTVITQNITVQLDAAGTATITPAQINNGSFDNCTIDTITLDITSFDCTNVGDNTVVLTVTDVNGNFAASTAVVTVEDVVAPVAIAQDITVELDAVTGTVTITPAQVDNGSFDNCSFTLSLDVTDFDCTNVGPNNVVLTVTDASGNTATAGAVVTVEDNTLPTVITQDFSIPLNSNGVIMLIPSQVDGGSYDNCGILAMSVTPNMFNCNDFGTHIVTLTVEDVNGNIAQNTATVTVYDMYDPVAIANDLTVQLDAAGTVNITAAQIDGGSNDICGIDSLTLSQTTFDCNDLGQNTVTLTVTDTYGNISTDTAIVTVQDVTPPAVAGQPVTVFLDANGQATITVADVDAGTVDNCGLQSLIITETAFDCDDLGNNIITLVATDINGNVSSVNVTVTVGDNIAPVAAAQDITVSLGTDGFVTITPEMINNNSTDNCGINAMSLDITTFDCTNIGDTTVTLTVSDAAGNEHTATAVVTVLPVPVPQTPSLNQEFCAIDEPVLADIEMSTNFVVWYADDTTTTQLQPFTPLETGTTYYAATGYGNCISDRIAITVTVNNPPSPTGEPIQFFCIEEEYTLADLRTDQDEVLWYSSPVGGTPLSAFTTLEHDNIYYAAYIDDNCESILRFPVRVIIRYCDVTIHNAVSANNDGKNDYFFIEGAESFGGNKLEIFNRWGVPVYEASNYGYEDNLFKGFANTGLKAGGSGLLPIGTYYYVFTFVNHDGQAITKTGFIHLTY